MPFGDKAPATEFFRLGDESEFAVVGEEEVGKASFDEDKRRFVANPKGSFRFAVHVFDLKSISVLEGSWGLYAALTDAIKKDGANMIYHVSRTGQGRDTRYSAEPIRELTDDEQMKIDETEYADLSERVSWLEKVSEDEIPF